MDEQPAPPAPEVVEKVEPAAPAQPAAAPEATTASDTPEERVPLAALMAERDKRQEHERRLKEAERELEALRKGQQQPAEVPSFFQDPEQHVRHVVQTVEASANDRLYAALEALVRETHPDYDEVFKEVEEHAKSNPAITASIFGSPNPALAAYKLGKQLRETRQLLEDPAGYRAKVEAEVRQQLEKEAADKDAARKKVADELPPDLTNTRSAKGDVPLPPESVFDEIFKP
ncbi:hypothetical protein [Lysobacter sp. Root667]|uniref:hypothetical protein n=1 Tax=Lysobacter sp. Root667 TaxID=1736581 RepID=UPI0012DE6FB0|nr:hypothetical protein [Lysobacter sp. Root667]